MTVKFSLKREDMNINGKNRKKRVGLFLGSISNNEDDLVSWDTVMCRAAEEDKAWIIEQAPVGGKENIET